MTIGELKELLDYYSDDEEVVFQVGSGNYWGDQIGRAIPDNANYGTVGYSDYLREDKILSEEQIEKYGDDYKNVREVVILNSGW
jgi:hypothetical protein